VLFAIEVNPNFINTW